MSSLLFNKSSLQQQQTNRATLMGNQSTTNTNPVATGMAQMQGIMEQIAPLMQTLQQASNGTANTAQAVGQLAQSDPNNWGWVNEQLQNANGNAKQAFMNAAKAQGLDVNQLTQQVQQMFGRS